MKQMRSRPRLAGAAVFVILASGAAARGQTSPSQTAAVVNGQAITMAEVQAVLKGRMPLSVQPTEAQRHQMESEVVESLIDERLMQQFLSEHAPAVADQELDQQVAQMRAALKAQNQTLEDRLKDRGMTEAELRANMRSQLQKARYARAHVTEADVRRCYDQNRDYFDHVVVRVSHILMRAGPTAPEADRRAAREKLVALRQQIVAGQLDFAEAAKKYSQCPSAADGGDLGYFGPKFDVDEAFARAAFALKVGQVSDVVQSAYAMHLIKVTDRKQEGASSDYEKLKEDVRKLAEEELLEGLQLRLRQLARIDYKLVEGVGAPAKRQ
jgi:peptidyl-prolyl cis-trans isomerase C